MSADQPGHHEPARKINDLFAVTRFEAARSFGDSPFLDAKVGRFDNHRVERYDGRAS
jgi:hypothetical protein